MFTVLRNNKPIVALTGLGAVGGYAMGPGFISTNYHQAYLERERTGKAQQIHLTPDWRGISMTGFGAMTGAFMGFGIQRNMRMFYR